MELLQARHNTGYFKKHWKSVFRDKFVFAWDFMDVNAITMLNGISMLQAAVKQLLIDYESSPDISQ